ncbi:diphthine--ammonia ligase [uncultured Maribacter sp.]|uniref:Dph6-related ATP pyrophosphatase n=1 Tax=uncultured Maribacter sp. TaxID=431308 RepID=UPI00260F5345|nr:diphthine--ammonia ligase [uncultured Maribacter sp.]
MKKAYFNWSSGKDAMLALDKTLSAKEYNITKLVTTVNTDYNRVSMHGLSVDLLEKQSEAIGIPLEKIELRGNVSMAIYNTQMKTVMTNLLKAGYEYAFFGDIFLEDLKKYREDKLAEVGVKAVFPLWKQNTKKLLLEFLQKGYKAITVCVNAKLLDASFCGRIIDEAFIEDLPENVDVCGENGEFHTFVFDGPIFKKPIDFTIGEKVLRSYTPSKNKKDNCYTEDNEPWDTSFWYCDLIAK